MIYVPEEPGREEQQQTVLHIALLSLRCSLQPAYKFPRLLSLGTRLSLAHLSFHLNNRSDIFLADYRELNLGKLEPINSEGTKWIDCFLLADGSSWVYWRTQFFSSDLYLPRLVIPHHTKDVSDQGNRID